MSPGNLPEKGNLPTNKNMPPNIINITPKNKRVLPNRLNSDIFIFPFNKIVRGVNSPETPIPFVISSRFYTIPFLTILLKSIP